MSRFCVCDREALAADNWQYSNTISRPIHLGAKEAFTAARDGNIGFLEKCIAEGADVDGYKDLVRFSFSYEGCVVRNITSV